MFYKHSFYFNYF